MDEDLLNWIEENVVSIERVSCGGWRITLQHRHHCEPYIKYGTLAEVVVKARDALAKYYALADVGLREQGVGGAERDPK